MLETLPLLNKYGYRRIEALELPHWEFWALVRSIVKLEAKEALTLLNVQLVASGQADPDSAGEYIQHLQNIIDDTPPPPKLGFEDLRNFLQAGRI